MPIKPANAKAMRLLAMCQDSLPQMAQVKLAIARPSLIKIGMSCSPISTVQYGTVEIKITHNTVNLSVRATLHPKPKQAYQIGLKEGSLMAADN